MNKVLLFSLLFTAFITIKSQIGRNDYIQKATVRKYTQIDASLKEGFILMNGKETDKSLIIRPKNDFDLILTSYIYVNGSVAIFILCNNFPNEQYPAYKKAVFWVDGEKFSYDMLPAELHYDDDLRQIFVSQRPVNQNMYKMVNKIIHSKNEITYTLSGTKKIEGKLSQEEISVLRNMIKLFKAFTEN
ncbi:hypothetical protein [Chryseobacterium takakiae]|uniref:Uncharacterized protein n=1 Tax=Chryseobacterium takakiae TaxID=1302685 RepID=A0A1M5BP75_9FLAO|nr:hypothetical protein [Chryseobacterium takakiae]SHF44196.1 hypothetical protein SAMN05444408_12112 [Chryseobacterium takakiae]